MARSVVSLLVLMAGVLVLPAQDQKSVPSPVGGRRYFSGIVISQNPDAITVSRTVLGRNSVLRVFTMSPETLIEGELKEKSRVTVRYVTRDEIHEAEHIIVRTSPKR